MYYYNAILCRAIRVRRVGACCVPWARSIFMVCGLVWPLLVGHAKSHEKLVFNARHVYKGEWHGEGL
jgi:hypothetical protein